MERLSEFLLLEVRPYIGEFQNQEYIRSHSSLL